MKSIVLNSLLATLALLFATQSIHAQNKPPTVTLTSNSTNEIVDAGATSSFLLTVQATDEDGLIQSVELIHNAESQGTISNPATFGVQVHPGFNEYYVIAVDNQNASATSAPVRVFGNSLPSIAFAEPAKPVALYSLNDSVLVRATASDLDGSVREVRLLENGTVIATDLQAPFEFVYKALRFGSFNLQLQAIDDRGSMQTTSPRTVTYTRIFDNLEFAIPTNTGTNHVLFGSNVGATHQKGEPEHAGVPTGKSIWYLWRPFFNGTVLIDTLGSDFDTVLAVYTNRMAQGITLSNMVAVASNDNDAPISPLSRVKFFARAGSTYYIAVDGRDGMAGNIQLKINQVTSRAPAHDFIANAVVTPSVHNSNNIGATKEPGEPDHAENPGGASMWYRINTFTGQQLRITTEGSTFDTLLAVYTNAVTQTSFPPSMENLRLVAFNDDGAVSNRTSEIRLTPRGSGIYWVAVDGYNGAEGNIRFSVTTVSQFTPPPNDFFGKATTLVGASALTNVNTFRATSEGDPAPLREPGTSSIAPRSVWYRWAAPSTGPVYMTTEWSDFDTILAVYTGTNVFGLNLVASNDDDPTGGQTSALLFNAVAGTQYHIGIAGYRGASGNLVFALNQNAFYLPRLVPQFQSGRMTLAVSDISSPVILESSNDLVEWHYERTITSEEPLDIVVSNEIPRAFYRVRTIE